jgi:hypothetical protein
LRVSSADLAGVPDARQLTWLVLDRDRRRERLLTGLTLASWFVALGLVLLAFVGFGLLMPMQAKLVHEAQVGRLGQADLQTAWHKSQAVAEMITLGIAAAVGMLGIAALCTVFLIRATRRATLRQINASLVEISEQLKQLRARPA